MACGGLTHGGGSLPLETIPPNGTAKRLRCAYVPLCVCVSLCVPGVAEVADEVMRLSDSTSEERSLSSFTSESFDDNGKSLTTPNRA